MQNRTINKKDIADEAMSFLMQFELVLYAVLQYAAARFPFPKFYFEKSLSSDFPVVSMQEVVNAQACSRGVAGRSRVRACASQNRVLRFSLYLSCAFRIQLHLLLRKSQNLNIMSYMQHRKSRRTQGFPWINVAQRNQNVINCILVILPSTFIFPAFLLS